MYAPLQVQGFLSRGYYPLAFPRAVLSNAFLHTEPTHLCRGILDTGKPEDPHDFPASAPQLGIKIQQNHSLHNGTPFEWDYIGQSLMVSNLTAPRFQTSVLQKLQGQAAAGVGARQW